MQLTLLRVGMRFYDSLEFSAWAVPDVSLDDVRRAWNARDPELPRLLLAIAQGEDPEPDTAVPEDVLTLQTYRKHMASPEFKKLSLEERRAYRETTMKALEVADEGALPPRFGLAAIVLEMWEDNGPFARAALIEVLGHTPIRWGIWRAVKRIFKESIERDDIEIVGVITARLDAAHAKGLDWRTEVSSQTLAYCVRRAWRYLRRTAETLPAAYADAASSVLRFYPDGIRWAQTWVGANILFANAAPSTRSHIKFRYGRLPKSPLTHRAFPELWKRTPRPLFTLLERAKSEFVRNYATKALQSDFRTTLREVEPAWVARLVTVGSGTIDDFVVWLLSNVPRFEESAFAELGLREPVLRLLTSDSRNAANYAAEYARTHARDLALEVLLRLVDSSHAQVSKLALALIGERDPRTEIGLEAWGQLLESRKGHALAESSLRKSFGASELSPEWFRDRLLGESSAGREFAISRLGEVHKIAKLGQDYFVAIVDGVGASARAINFAMTSLFTIGPAKIDHEVIRRGLLHPVAGAAFLSWLDVHVDPSEIGADFLKRVAFHPTFESDPWIVDLKASAPWASELEFDEGLSQAALNMLSDIRKFSPDEIGFEWLMQLVQRSEVSYHEFAVEYMIKAFVPADFAESDGEEEVAEESAGDGEINIDLDGASFVFTGKLKTMTRKEAQGKVTTANGTNKKGVSADLDYLVIGDEGSPLYGGGRKGSKQVKAEKLIDAGSAMRIISETAFLQMLAGEQREFSDDAVEEGCTRLWNLATSGDVDSPLGRFARRYIRRHHPEIGLAMSDRPVDPGAEVPDSFLTYERVAPLFASHHTDIRGMALQLAHYELARWAPPIESIVSLAETPHDDVRHFVRKALLADESREHRRYRIDPKVLTADAVYGFCESNDAGTRALGMQLIARDPALAVPEELFRLTESPDRKVRAFVIQTFWSVYRDRGITLDWKPSVKPAPEASRKRGRKRRAAAEEAAPEVPQGAPKRPDAPPAGEAAMRDLLRRILFEIPPARPPKRAPGEDRLRPLPARRAKLALVEVIRDLACAERAFCELVGPLFQEFVATRGQSERAACLVALTRLRAAHPDLNIAIAA